MNRIILCAITAMLCLVVLAGCGQDAASPVAPATDTAVPGNTPAAAATDTTAPLTSAPLTAAPTSSTAATNTAIVAAPAKAAAIVNGEAIPLADYEAQVALAQASLAAQITYTDKAEREASAAQLNHQVLEWMIDEVLIKQAATNLGIVVDETLVQEEFAKSKGNDPAAFAKWLQENSLTEETFLEQLRSELLGTGLFEAVTGYLPDKMEQVRVRHILVASTDEANNILAQIKTNDDFARLAKLHSLDQGTAESGGDLGFYPRGVLPIEIENVAFSMVVGQISGAISTSYGYHIVQVLERDPNRELSSEMAIALQQQAFTDWLDAERTKAKIEYLE